MRTEDSKQFSSPTEGLFRRLRLSCNRPSEIIAISAMPPLKMNRPPGWGKPKLTSFFEDAWANAIASFANKSECHRLCRIDDLIFEIAQDWRGKAPTVETIVALLMFFRAHSAFRSSAMLGMSGATVEAMAVLRLALEFTGYSALVAQTPEFAKLWWNRDNDPDSKKKFVRAFTHGAIRSALERYNKSLSEAYEALYERTIQFGGHPNEKAVSANIRIQEGLRETKIDQVYLQGDGLALDQWIRTANQTGICILRTFVHIHPKRFEELDVERKIVPLASGL